MLGTLHWAVNKTPLCPRVFSDADVHRARWTKSPAGQDEHARRDTSNETFLLSRHHDRVTARATLVDPRSDRMIHLDVRVEIDQVQLRLPAGFCGTEIGDGTVVAHSGRGDGTRAFAEPSQLSRIWPEQCRGAQ